MKIWDWILNEHFWWFSLICVFLPLPFGIIGTRLEEKQNRIGLPLTLVASLIYFFWFFVAIIKLLKFIPTGLNLINNHMAIVKLPLLFLILILVGGSLYVFRVYRRIEYGFAEIAFALASIFVASSQALSDPQKGSSWTGLVGGAYLLVRGLDNVSTDKKSSSVEFQKNWIKGVRTNAVSWWNRLNNVDSKNEPQ